MIETAMEIGKIFLNKDNPEQRTKSFLTSLSLRPIVGKNLIHEMGRVPREVVLNLNTKKELIEIIEDEEHQFLSNENIEANKLEKLRNEIFAFDIESSNSKKVFANTKNFDYLPIVLDHIVQRINSEFNDKLSNLRNFLIELRETFCIEIDDSRDSYFIDLRKTDNYELKTHVYEFLAKNLHRFIKNEKINELGVQIPGNLIARYKKGNKDKEKKNILSEYLQNLAEQEITVFLKKFIEKDKSGYRNILNDYLLNNILQIPKNTYDNFDKEEQIPLFSLKIDDQYLHEIDEIKNEYLELVEHELKERFFSNKSDIAKNSLCSLCKQKKKIVTGKIDIPTKFYLKDKPYFFENLQENNKWKAFSVCDNCLEELLVGTNYMRDNMEAEFFYSQFLIVPKNLQFLPMIDRNKIDEIKSIVETAFTEEKSISEIDDRLKRHGRFLKELVKNNQRVDFLFFVVPQGQGASFKVIEIVQDIEWEKIIKLINTIYSTQNSEFYEDLFPVISFKIIRNLLFPSFYSHPKVPYDSFRKELLIFLKRLLKHHTMDQKQLIRKFVTIQEKTFRRGTENQSPAEKIRTDYFSVENSYFFTSPLHMHIFLKTLYDLNSLKGATIMKSGENFVQIEETTPKLDAFFKTHPEIYGKSPVRRGLVALGFLMHKILSRQLADKKKGTVMHKLNFGGIPHNRLKTFICDIADMLTIYDIYRSAEVRIVLAYVQDSIISDDSEALSPQENVFFILTGISVGRYINPPNKRNGEEENE